MNSTDAPTHVGEPLIQVLSETMNAEETSPDLFTPPEPTPTMDSANLVDGSEPPPELPDALLNLQKSGHHMQVVSCEAWKVRGSHVRIRKDLSMCFTVDAVVSSHDIIVGLDQASIDVDDIVSIQRRASNNSWVVTFASRAVKDAALNEHSITIAGCSVFAGDCEIRVSIVKIYELPGEIPDSVVVGRLAHYGRVISFRRDRVADAIFNGVRTARMLIERPIPAQAFIAGEYVRFWYPNQPKTCRKCGSEDHLAANCKSQRCFNWERPGHRAEQCNMPALCRVCLADGHETTNCPYIYYSSNITSAKPADKSTDESTDKPASKSTMSYSGAARAGKVAAAAREAEDNISEAKRDEDKRARREKERKEKERREKERREERELREEKEQKKEKERKEKERRERRERERDERDYEDQRERDK